MNCVNFSDCHPSCLENSVCIGVAESYTGCTQCREEIELTETVEGLGIGHCLRKL